MTASWAFRIALFVGGASSIALAVMAVSARATRKNKIIMASLAGVAIVCFVVLVAIYLRGKFA